MVLMMHPKGIPEAFTLTIKSPKFKPFSIPPHIRGIFGVRIVFLATAGQALIAPGGVAPIAPEYCRYAAAGRLNLPSLRIRQNWRSLRGEVSGKNEFSDFRKSLNKSVGYRKMRKV
jgi:hypothetical protein